MKVKVKGKGKMASLKKPKAMIKSLSQWSQDINRDKFVFFRERSEVTLANFKLELKNSNWAVISGFEDPSEAYRVFVDKYISVYNKCFPLKRVKAIKLNLQKPWLSKGLVKSVRKKNALYKRYLNNPIPKGQNQILRALGKSSMKSSIEEKVNKDFPLCSELTPRIYLIHTR